MIGPFQILFNFCFCLLVFPNPSNMGTKKKFRSFIFFSSGLKNNVLGIYFQNPFLKLGEKKSWIVKSWIFCDIKTLYTRLFLNSKFVFFRLFVFSRSKSTFAQKRFEIVKLILTPKCFSIWVFSPPQYFDVENLTFKKNWCKLKICFFWKQLVSIKHSYGSLRRL